MHHLGEAECGRRGDGADTGSRGGGGSAAGARIWRQSPLLFVAHRLAGIFNGAATSFFAYVGFDVIATSAEEAINPNRNIPIAIVLSLSICAVLYM